MKDGTTNEAIPMSGSEAFFLHISIAFEIILRHISKYANWKPQFIVVRYNRSTIVNAHEHS